MESKYPLRAVDFSGGQRGEGRSRKEGEKSKQADLYIYLGRLSTTGYCSGHCSQPTAPASMVQV